MSTWSVVRASDVMVNDNNRNTVVNVIFRLKITKKSTNITYSIIRR